MFCALIDLWKAFDSVTRSKLWKCVVEEYGMTNTLQKALESTYKPCSCLVKTDYEKDEWFEVTAGVKQGSVLSPVLFIWYMNYIIKKYKDSIGGQGDGDVLVCADDLACWSNSRLQLERSFNC